MAIKLQLRTLRRNVVRRHRKVSRGPRGGRFTFRKSEHQARHSQFAHWLSRWPAGLVWDRSGQSSIRRERSNKTKLPKAWSCWARCKCRLVCEWVCTVTSASVRIEKRANCAKNNKPKSGGLFLVNARPFPEHSSSRATFSAERAWLEAEFTSSGFLFQVSLLSLFSLSIYLSIYLYLSLSLSLSLSFPHPLSFSLFCCLSTQRGVATLHHHHPRSNSPPPLSMRDYPSPYKSGFLCVLPSCMGIVTTTTLCPLTCSEVLVSALYTVEEPSSFLAGDTASVSSLSKFS